MTELVRGFDAAMDVRRALPAAVKAGCGMIGRYYSRHPAKNLSPAEAAAISAAGIAIVAVWEAQGDRAANFTAAQGAKDAADALACAREVGQPEGSAIYFAVDFDPGAVLIEQRIKPYFAEVNAALAGRYQVGIYGSGLCCANLLREGLARWAWRGAIGWQGGRLFTQWHIGQHPPGDPWGFGFPVDPDECRADGFGGFRVPAGKPAVGVVSQGAATQLSDDKAILTTVELLQRQLADRGFYTGAIDGLFGPQSVAALDAYRKAKAA